MTIKLIAWATTSSTTPGAEPGIGVQYTTVEDGLTVDYGDVEVSEGQPLEWGVTEHGDFDGEAADELLERMGFRRVEAWVESGGPYAAEVERIAEES